MGHFFGSCFGGAEGPKAPESVVGGAEGPGVRVSKLLKLLEALGHASACLEALGKP